MKVYAMGNSDLFWNSRLNDLENGFVEDERCVTCLLCGVAFEKGIIYQDGGIFYEASRYARVHIEKTHGSVFESLLSLDKKLTGLTDHQSALLRLFYKGKSDGDIKKEMGIGSSSTIRNHRFLLKEKERQAKIFLALMELLGRRDSPSAPFLNFPRSATMKDDRYNITETEKSVILRRFFPKGIDGELVHFPAKEKHKLIVLRLIADKFEPGKIYAEYEINKILMTVFEDYVTLRRYLVEYGFLDRKQDCSEYWLK